MIVQATLAICEAFSDSLQTILHPESAYTMTGISAIALQITLQRQCLGGGFQSRVRGGVNPSPEGEGVEDFMEK